MHPNYIKVASTGGVVENLNRISQFEQRLRELGSQLRTAQTAALIGFPIIGFLSGYLAKKLIEKLSKDYDDPSGRLAQASSLYPWAGLTLGGYLGARSAMRFDLRNVID